MDVETRQDDMCIYKYVQIPMLYTICIYKHVQMQLFQVICPYIYITCRAAYHAYSPNGRLMSLIRIVFRKTFIEWWHPVWMRQLFSRW